MSWRRRVVGSALALLVSAASGCDECDAALEKVCACPGVDCDGDAAPAIVGALQRCDRGELEELYAGNLPVCIEEEDSYCAVVTGLESDDDALCRQDCSGACDAQGSCSEFQYASCDLPEGASK